MGSFFRVFFILALMFGPASSFAKSVYGTFVVVKGKVKVKSFKTKKTKKARVGEKVFPQDVIITEKEARAKVVMIDKNEINISPASQIEIAQYEYDPAKNKKNVLLNVIYGKVRNKVKQKYNNKTSQFKVKTPSAVAGVRGTDFFTSYNPANQATRVITFEGQVSFGLPGSGGQILNAVDVNPGQFTENFLNKPPSLPVEMPKNELANFDRGSRADFNGNLPQGPEGREPANGPRNRPKNGSGLKGPNGPGGPNGPLPPGANFPDGKEEFDGERPKKGPRNNYAGSNDGPFDPRMSDRERGPANFNKEPNHGPGDFGHDMIRPEDMPTFAGGDMMPEFEMNHPDMINKEHLHHHPINHCEFCEELTKDGLTRLIVNPVK